MFILGHPKVKKKLEDDLRKQFGDFGSGTPQPQYNTIIGV